MKWLPMCRWLRHGQGRAGTWPSLKAGCKGKCLNRKGEKAAGDVSDMTHEQTSPPPPHGEWVPVEAPLARTLGVGHSHGLQMG